MFSATRALRQAAVHAERTPLIKFLGPRTIPSTVDHTPKAHPASPEGTLPASWAGYGNGDAASRHKTFSSYRDAAQQHGPLQNSIRSESGVGGSAGAALGSIHAPEGVFFDVSELPSRFHRAPLNAAEIEAVESGGAAIFEHDEKSQGEDCLEHLSRTAKVDEGAGGKTHGILSRCMSLGPTSQDHPAEEQCRPQATLRSCWLLFRLDNPLWTTRYHAAKRVISVLR
ncbi:hypothetical protein FZEAL_10258 [Fusarium zealandicum]|uniref:Uncharacterized protein n=1 Tax=Fusarium zealandicum TaxID=1053134 RepID=A0A8H4U412_9HYPO|nr:hypothetical protein FZEAL_10258 [Fusarium zealandicum]